MKQLMKSMEANPMRLLAGACSLVLTLCLSQAGVAQQTAGAAPASPKTFAAVPFSSLAPGASQTPAKPTADEEEETANPQKTRGEGVKVHGHWVIDVRNADGSLAQHRDFHNSLVTNDSYEGGDWALTYALSGAQTPGGLTIGFVTVDTTAHTDPSVYCFGGSLGSCYLFTATNNALTSVTNSLFSSAKNVETGLVSTLVMPPRTVPGSFGALTYVLSGNYVIPAGLGTINAVQTYMTLCAPNTSSPVGTTGFILGDFSPSKCVAGQITANETAGVLPFTSTTVTSGTTSVPLPITGLTAGQVISVTVTLSFS